MSDTRSVWVGCLACYNGGRLVGRWIEATDAESITVADLHASHKIRTDLLDVHEELWCLDVDDASGWIEGECSPMEAARLARMADAIEADGYPLEAVAAWRDNGNDLDEWDRPTREKFADAYAGEWSSVEEYAADLAEQLGVVTGSEKWPSSCIDWSRAWEELSTESHWCVNLADGNVYVFRDM